MEAKQPIIHGNVIQKCSCDICRDKIPGMLASGFIQVCAWCYPGDSIFKRFPEWAHLGLTISHGICSPCKAKWLASAPAIFCPGCSTARVETHGELCPDCKDFAANHGSN